MAVSSTSVLAQIGMLYVVLAPDAVAGRRRRLLAFDADDAAAACRTASCACLRGAIAAGTKRRVVTVAVAAEAAATARALSLGADVRSRIAAALQSELPWQLPLRTLWCLHKTR